MKSDTELYPIPSHESFDLDNIDYNHPLVWAAYGNAKCKGIFQVDSRLGFEYCRKLKPKSIIELSNLISLVRPGPLESGETELYYKRIIGEEPVTYLHPSLEPILNKTLGVIAYQEDCSKIVMDICGFTPSEAEALRSCLAKKIPHLVTEQKEKVISGAIKKGIITKEKAEEIFAIIQKFQRYGFCKIHGCEYAINSYKSMYLKVFFPTEWYISWLTYADEKIDPQLEISELIQDAKLNGIEILKPDITLKNAQFQKVGDKQICFGLSTIKNIGQAALATLMELDLPDFKSFLKNCKKIRRNICESLIKSGACDIYGLGRKTMLRQVMAAFGVKGLKEDIIEPFLKPLTDKEFQVLTDNLDNGIVAAFEEVIKLKSTGKKRDEGRIEIMQAKMKWLQQQIPDTNKDNYLYEKIYLGCGISCSATEDFEFERGSVQCRDVLIMAPGKFKINAVVDDIERKVSGPKAKVPGQEYAFIKVSDNSSSVKLILWPDIWSQYSSVLEENLVITVEGRKNIWAGKEQVTANVIKVVG